MNINLNNISRCRFVCMLLLCVFFIRRCRSLVLLINAAAVLLFHIAFLNIRSRHRHCCCCCLVVARYNSYIGVCVRLRLARFAIALNNAYVIHNCERSTKRFNILLSFVFISISLSLSRFASLSASSAHLWSFLPLFHRDDDNSHVFLVAIYKGYDISITMRSMCSALRCFANWLRFAGFSIAFFCSWLF